MAAEEGRALSLNERLNLSLSRGQSTPHRPTDIMVRKVKLEGRRRLCKMTSSPDGENPNDTFSPGSSPGEKSVAGVCDTDRAILDDISSRLETLSFEKSDHSLSTGLQRSEGGFKSAATLLASSSSEEKRLKGIKEVKGKTARPLVLELGDDTRLRGKALERLAVDDSDEEDFFALGSGDKLLSGDCDYAVEDTNADLGDPIMMNGTGKCKGLSYILPGKIATMLYPHQRVGLEWLWSLHCGGTGGILGDDMGLGKTLQISSFLAGLFHSSLINRVLIVAPKTLLGHWMKELLVVGLSALTREYHSNSKARDYELQHVLKEGGILLTTYDIVRNNSKLIRGDLYIDDDRCEDGMIWDYTILDEGHIIKNPKTQRAKSLHEIPSRHRVIISGTPIQNNLKELWALFHYCCPELLCGKDEFKTKYENPVLRGNDKHASDRDKHIGSAVAKELRERIKPYFLRRLKSDFFSSDDAAKNAQLSRKNEIIVWLKLTSVQRKLYEAFLKSKMVHSSTCGSSLLAITILKKICDHPLLLTKRAADGVLEGMHSMLNHQELGEMEDMVLNLANVTNDNVHKAGQDISCKLNFIMALLESLVRENHHILIFSQTRKMLNLIEEAILSDGYSYLRIDGTTKFSEREEIIKDFQEGNRATIFLLTSQVGGLGLTLTKADRVIVVDPAWNPSTDNQSVDRAYRIGQKRDVLVYRLITSGTVEEKIYKMQVFKGGLFKTATEQKEYTRYFSQKDIRELFSLPEQGFDVSITQQQLHEEHDQQHAMDDHMKTHIEFLMKQGIAGVSHHSLLFSKAATIPFASQSSYSESSLMGNHIAQSSRSKPSVEISVNGAQFAFKPKDLKLFSQEGSSQIPEELKEDPKLIAERIHRLSRTLENKVLVSKLPDKGEKLQKQILELKAQLNESRESTSIVPFERKHHEVIDLDDLSDDLKKIVSV